MAAPATLPIDIANMALSELGQEPIADLTTLTNKPVRMVNAQYAFVRDEVLRAHPWNCATKRATLAVTEKTITGITAANPPVVTSASHGLATGTFVVISEVVGMTELNGQRCKITSLSSSTFSLQDTAGTNIDGSAYTAYTSGGVATVCPAWGFAYLYAVPSDFIRITLAEDQDAPFRVQGAYIVSDVADLNIEYIYRLTDVSLMDQLLVSAIAARLAAQIALPLTGNDKLKMAMESLYEKRLSEARFADSREQQGEDVGAYSWVNARTTGSSEVAPTRAN